MIIQESRLQRATYQQAAYPEQTDTIATLSTTKEEDTEPSKKRRLDGEAAANAPAEPAGVPSTGSPAANACKSQAELTVIRSLTLWSILQQTMPVGTSLKGQMVPSCQQVATLKSMSCRDRENSTVSVAGLSINTDEDSIRKLFRDVRLVWI